MRQAFEAVALVHRERLYRTAVRLCRNATEAEDLVQETYLRAFRRFDRFAAGTNCLAWLQTILRNLFLSRVTRGGREVPSGNSELFERVDGVWAPAVPTPEEEFFRGVIDDRGLAMALERLPAYFREVLLLADVEECPLQEVAERCELPVGTVMSRVFRARRLVRKALGGRPGMYEGPGAAGRAGRRRRIRRLELARVANE